MSQYPIFLSIVIITNNDENTIERNLKHISNNCKTLASDYEIIVIDNASKDKTVLLLKDFTSLEGLPNLQVYALTTEVDSDAAAWAGIENTLGDFIVVFNPSEDDLSVLPDMLKKAVSGSDVVFGVNQLRPMQTIGYKVANGLFNFIYKWLNGIHLTKEAPDYRVLSKRVAEFWRPRQDSNLQPAP